jgi:hypothetical protein
MAAAPVPPVGLRLLTDLDLTFLYGFMLDENWSPVQFANALSDWAGFSDTAPTVWLYYNGESPQNRLNPGALEYLELLRSTYTPERLKGLHLDRISYLGLTWAEKGLLGTFPVPAPVPAPFPQWASPALSVDGSLWLVPENVPEPAPVSAPFPQWVSLADTLTVDGALWLVPENVPAYVMLRAPPGEPAVTD